MAATELRRLIGQCTLAYGLNTDGLCCWCGEPIPLDQTAPWWCSLDCAHAFDEAHVWRLAQPAAMRRAARRCARCQRTATEVHHDPPVGAAGYTDGCQHHPDRLTALCHTDHVHAEQQLRTKPGKQLQMFAA